MTDDEIKRLKQVNLHMFRRGMKQFESLDEYHVWLNVQRNTNNDVQT